MALAVQTVDASHGGVVLGILPIATALVAIAITHERPKTLFWIASIAGAAALLEPASAANKGRPFYIAAAAASPSARAAVTSPSVENKPARLADQIPVRVVGAPFVPNTNPRER